MNTRNAFLISLIAACAIFLAACGDSDESAGAASAAIAVPELAAGTRVIEVTANDAMKFSVGEIRVKPGESLRIAFSNVGKMPKQSMAHNWVLLKPMNSGDINAFGMKAAANPPSYLPADSQSVIAHTKMLGGGESDYVDFQAPSEPGVYPFICTFPGHYALMRGQLIVE